MRLGKLFIICFFICCSIMLRAQDSCNYPGENPGTAQLVCGTNTIVQNIMPHCGNDNVSIPCTNSVPIQSSYFISNPFWYKIKCYKGGTLQFLIIPSVITDHYDWMLFDVTGKNPSDVFRNSALLIAGNIAPRFGQTGTRQAGSSEIFTCNRQKAFAFSPLPTIITSHEYLLLVCHDDAAEAGYTLNFNGGTAVITDTTPPKITAAISNCRGNELRLKTNKKLECNTIAADGTDFEIVNQSSKVIAATGMTCMHNAEFDSVFLVLDKPLVTGNYLLQVKQGSDGNTLQDVCANSIGAGSTIPFHVDVPAVPGIGTLLPLNCGASTLQLFFQKNVLCSSVANDGSDFFLTGPSDISIINANEICDAETNLIMLTLSEAISVAGEYTLHLRKGTDGNTILNDCGLATPEGISFSFMAKAAVSAAFTYRLHTGCAADTVNFFHDGSNGVTNWQWTFDNAVKLTAQNPVMLYSQPGEKDVQLIVNNGDCTDTTEKHIKLAEKIHAAFETAGTLCPEDSAFISNTSTGTITSYNWNFGNGNYSNEKNPPPQSFYPFSVNNPFALVSLTVTDSMQCSDTYTAKIELIKNCHIAVPSAFTPNHDGLNDYLYPLNAYKATNLNFKIFNRFGQLVFETNDWTRKWDGAISGTPQPTGSYIWILTYTDDAGKRIFKKGVSTLIR